MNFFPPRVIVCSWKMYWVCKARYKTRDVVAAKECPENTYYYFNLKTGRVRMVNKGEIWVCDYETGPPDLKRIR